MRKQIKSSHHNKSIVFTFVITVVILFVVTAAFAYLNITIINNRSEKDVYSLNESMSYSIENIVANYNDEILKEFEKYKDEDKDITIKSIYEKYSYKDNNRILATGYYQDKENITIYYNNSYNNDKINKDDIYNVRYNEKVSFIDLNSFFDSYHVESNAILHSITYSSYTFFAIQSFEEIENEFIKLYQQDSKNSNNYYFLASNDGAIYITNYSEKYPNLSVLFNSQEKSESFLYEIINHNSCKQTFTLNSLKYYLIGNSLLDGYNNYNLIYISVVSDEFVKNYYSTIKLLTILFSCIVLVVLFVSFWIIAISLSWKYLYVARNKFTFKYARGYSLLASYDGKIILSNKGFKEIGESYHNINDFDLDDNTKKVKDYLAEGKSFTAKFLNKDGKIMYVRFNVIRVHSMYHLIGDAENEASLAGTKVLKVAYYNSVSNILNINALEDRINTILNNKERKTAICFDIINFKNLNSLFGSSFGDDVICYLTEFLKQMKAENDELYSMHSEKVCILTDTLDNYGEMFEKAKKIYDELIKPQTINLNELNLSIGCGIYEIPLDNSSLNASKVIANINIANKRSHSCEGRKIYTYDKGLFNLLERESIIIEDIKKAIENNEFVIHFQPQYDLATNSVAGFEALLRWNNPKYINESPYEYVRLAEKTNLIVRIGNIINTQAFEAAKFLNEKGYHVHISVNVSIAQLLQAGFVENFLEYYKKYNVPFEAISIEITETMLMTSMQEIKEKLTILKDKGIDIYLDDFGMGYSSLQYINELPVSYIKFDREFIRYLQHSKSSRIIVGRFLDMANDLGIDSVAEGVEDKYQVNFLMRHKCHLIQGYIVSKAVPFEKLEELTNLKTKINTKLQDDVKEDDTIKNNTMFSKKVS